MSRPLTDADFRARHKFSFDMYVSGIDLSSIEFAVADVLLLLPFHLASASATSSRLRPSTTSNSKITLLGFFVTCVTCVGPPASSSCYVN